MLAQDARSFVPWMFSTYIGKNSPIFTIWSCFGLGCQIICAMNVFAIYSEKFPYFTIWSCVGSGCQTICAMNVFTIYRGKFPYFHFLQDARSFEPDGEDYQQDRQHHSWKYLFYRWYTVRYSNSTECALYCTEFTLYILYTVRYICCKLCRLCTVCKERVVGAVALFRLKGT